jgi:hypothetical protein
MFLFLSVKIPLVLSLFTKLWIVCLLGTLPSWNLRRNFRRHFPADPYFTYVSYRNTHWSKLYRTMTLTYCNWVQMANGTDNCFLLLTNLKHFRRYEPHCLPWNMMPSSGLQVTYFPSFQTLSADSLAKFACASQQEAHWPAWSPEQWTQVTTKLPGS